MQFCNVLVHNIFGRLQRHFAHVTSVTVEACAEIRFDRLNTFQTRALPKFDRISNSIEIPLVQPVPSDIWNARIALLYKMHNAMENVKIFMNDSRWMTWYIITRISCKLIYLFVLLTLSYIITYGDRPRFSTFAIRELRKLVLRYMWYHHSWTKSRMNMDIRGLSGRVRHAMPFHILNAWFTRK